VTKPIRLFAALGAVLFVVVGLAACGGGVPGNAVVNVEGSQAITKAAFTHWMTVASSSGASGEKPAVPDPPNYTTCVAHLKQTTAATTKGQKAPTEAELKKQCETQYKSLQQEVLKIKHQQFKKPEEFEKFLKTSGQTVSDLLLRVKLNMLSQKIQAKIVKEKPKVSQAEVQKYYNENKSKYGTPEKRAAQIVLTKTEEQAKEAKKELESGKSFSEVAKKRSIDPTSKAKGGQLGEVVKGQDDASLDNALFAAKANELGGPVKSPFGYYLYDVTSIKAGNSQPLSKVETSIKQTLSTQAQQKKLSNFIKNFKKKWQGKTDCNSGYVVANCKQYKAPKTTSTGASGTTSTSG
jgi:foldase protein PrsA